MHGILLDKLLHHLHKVVVLFDKEFWVLEFLRLNVVHHHLRLPAKKVNKGKHKRYEKYIL
jgi:hypothetical protein